MEISIVRFGLNGIPFMQVEISMEIDWNFHLQVSKVEISIPYSHVCMHWYAVLCVYEPRKSEW